MQDHHGSEVEEASIGRTRKQGDNWFWIDNAMIDELGAQLGPYGLAVYACVARHVNQQTQSCYIGAPKIASKIGTSVRQVRAEIKKLERLRLIQKTERTGRSSIICLTTPAGYAGVRNDTPLHHMQPPLQDMQDTPAPYAHITRLTNNTPLTTKPSAPKKPSAAVDDRHSAIRDHIQKRYTEAEPLLNPAPWDGQDGKALNKLLKSNPGWTIEQITTLVDNRFLSLKGAVGDRAYLWLPKLSSYTEPLDEYGKPKRLSKKLSGFDVRAAEGYGLSRHALTTDACEVDRSTPGANECWGCGRYVLTLIDDEDANVCSKECGDAYRARKAHKKVPSAVLEGVGRLL
jgi:hypothetical protein